ncbi:hypothetical protein Tco_0708508 [Tanacetum coccineum]
MMVITLMFISLDSRKLRLNSRCVASLAKLAKDVVKPNLTHLRFDVKKVRPWNKAHGLRDYMLDYAYDVSVSSQDRIDVEPPSKVNWFADVLVKRQGLLLSEIKYSDMDMTERLRMQHMGANSLAPSYTLIIEPLRRLCHWLIAFTIFGKGQALKKVITTDLFFLRSIDEGTVVNVPYLLA